MKILDLDAEAPRLANEAVAADPEMGLRAVAALRRLTERIEALQVENARRQGWSWQRIGAALGVTKQAVHDKHARRLEAQGEKP